MPPLTAVQAARAAFAAGELNIAEAGAKAVLARVGEHMEALAPLARIAHRTGRSRQVAALLTRARTARHRDAEGFLMFGLALRDLGAFSDARVALDQALRLGPRAAEALVTLGQALRDLGQWQSAEAALTAALALNPENNLARFNLGAVRLTLGHLREGWPDLIAGGAAIQTPVRLPGPEWRGETLDGGTVLLHADGGLGDAIMYARYVPLVAERARVVIAGPPTLQRLFATLPGLAGFCGDLPLPPYDRHRALGDLPLLFDTALGSIPAAVPYLTADPAAAARWRVRMAGLPGLRVGLVWSGNPSYPGDRERSVPPAALAPILAIPGVSFVSLQFGPVEAPAGVRQWMTEVRDLADTAALIAALDLTITVDTAVVHLAGALGCPVWLLNRLNTDWRWLLGRDDSPWYSGLRQFRQTEPGDWSGPVALAAAALAERAPGAGA